MSDDFALFDSFLPPEEKAVEITPPPAFVQNAWNANHTTYTRKVTVENSILNDVQGLGLSEDVIILANQIFLRTTGAKTIRGKSRLGIICTCVYYACNQIEPNTMSYDEVVRLFKIDTRVALKGFRLVNHTNSGAVTCFTATPETYIILFLKKLNAAETMVQEAVDAFRALSAKLSTKPRPQSTASAFLSYWLKRRESAITVEQLSLVTGVSKLTIEKIEKEIEWQSTQ